MPARDPSEASVSRRMNPPSMCLSSSAAHRNVEMARVTSILDHLRGLPPSRATTSASSSTRSATRREMCIIASARAWTGRLRDSSNVETAAVTASSTSASVGTPSVATTESSYGLWTSSVPSPVRHDPAT
jgi:hypothetical protein